MKIFCRKFYNVCIILDEWSVHCTSPVLMMMVMLHSKYCSAMLCLLFLVADMSIQRSGADLLISDQVTCWQWRSFTEVSRDPWCVCVVYILVCVCVCVCVCLCVGNVFVIVRNLSANSSCSLRHIILSIFTGSIDVSTTMISERPKLNSTKPKLKGWRRR